MSERDDIIFLLFLDKPKVSRSDHNARCLHSAAEDTEYQHGHELAPSDWIAVELADVQGDVMSNNPTANGAFAILHAGKVHGGDSVSGIVDHYETHPMGIANVQFERPISTMRELRVSKMASKREQIPQDR